MLTLPLSASAQRVFLGWNGPPLAAAERWLVERFGADFRGVIVATPGARAGRALEERLSRALGPAWHPPRITTAGRLSDELLEARGRPAGRLARTLAWQRALEELAPERLRRLVGCEPRYSDHASWARLAEEVRTLFGALAAEGLDFAAVHARHVSARAGETARWHVLAELQDAASLHLARAGLVDPHRSRLSALDERRVRSVREVVLVGVVDANAITRRALAELGSAVTALVFAPAEESASFDAQGCLEVERWCAHDVPLDLARWKIAEGPGDQAEIATRAIAAWNGRFAAEDVTVGIADPEVAPYLARALAEHGIAARDAAGTALGRTAPLRLVAALADFLSSRSAASYAALLRHPDFEAALRARLAGEGDGSPALDPAALDDRYHAAHLPPSIDGRWLGSDGRRERERQDCADAQRLYAVVLALIGPLADERRAPLSRWPAAIRALLLAVYGGREPALQPERERVLAESLRAIGDVLDELASLPPALAREADAAEALRWLVRALAGAALSPAPVRGTEPSIELLGWLELALDDAPALVVTGFSEGRVPERVRRDGWLPNSLRSDLAIEDDRRRVARDAYVTVLLARSRAEVVFVSGRRDREGNPLLPCRIAFHAPVEEAVARVRHSLRHPSRRHPGRAPARGAARTLPRQAELAAPRRFGVSSFRTWYESPYLFYLERVLGLETVEDGSRELDARGFGSLAHEVLECLGRAELCAETDATVLRAALDRELERVTARTHGEEPLPAVALQKEQLRSRLARFAEAQARRAREGWQIAHVEWRPSRPVELDVDGEAIELRGQIDRIDVHADGRWAIFDYKTGDKPPDPEKAHRAGSKDDKRWRDLQLPLYVHLARELARPGFPELGYATLASDAGGADFARVAGWGDAEVQDALQEVRAIVRAVRAGTPCFDAGAARPRSPVFAALLGQGLLDRGDDEDPEPAP